jgi:hypothetical protein
MKNRVLMKRFNVLGFPSIYLLKDGSTWQYNGVRTVADVSCQQHVIVGGERRRAQAHGVEVKEQI